MKMVAMLLSACVRSYGRLDARLLEPLQMKRFLFVCSQNRLRSPTAEQVFATWPGLETMSAGTNNDADNPLSSELIEWADAIFVMEKAHRNKIRKRFGRALNGKRLVSLDVPDDYDFMDPALVRLLEARMARFLPSADAKATPS
jgi:predicted protein tyrosine phosphatase